MKKYELILLFDIYGSMLTERQYRVMNLYINEDLSFAEIADELDISRQGVRDFIKKSETVLYELDEKLKIKGRFEEISSMLQELKIKLSEENVSEDTIDYLNKIIDYENS